MKILITGATGFIGSVLVPKIIEKYGRQNVCAFVIPNDPFLKKLKEHNIELRTGSIVNYEEVLNAIIGIDIIIHLTGLTSYWRLDKNKLYDVNVRGVENIVRASIKCKVSKLIHISSAGAIGISHNSKILADENTEFNWPSTFYYMHTKYAGQEIVKNAIKENKLNAVILNPAAVMGPGDYNINTPHNKIYYSIYKKFLFGSFSGGTGIVDVRDVCNIISQSIEKKGCTGFHILSGDNVEYQYILKTIAKCAKKENRIFPVKVSYPLLMLFGLLSELVGTILRRPPLLTYSYGKLSAWYTYYSNEKSRSVFSYSYLPFEETIRDTCQYFENTFLKNF